MAGFLLWVGFGVFGVAYVLGHSQVSRRAREQLYDDKPLHPAWDELLPARRAFVGLLECPACCSFHLGWIVGLGAGYGLRAILLAFYTCGFSATIGLISGLMKE